MHTFISSIQHHRRMKTAVCAHGVLSHCSWSLWKCINARLWNFRRLYSQFKHNFGVRRCCTDALICQKYALISFFVCYRCLKLWQSIASHKGNLWGIIHMRGGCGWKIRFCDFDQKTFVFLVFSPIQVEGNFVEFEGPDVNLEPFTPSASCRIINIDIYLLQ